MTVTLVAEGETTTGLWCRTCMLPSRVRIELVAISEDGAGPLGVADFCTEHDQ